MYIVETEFLFGLRADDRWHKQVLEIIKLYKIGKIKHLYCSTSAFLEVGAVLQARGFPVEDIEESLFLMKQKIMESNIEEIELTHDDIIRLYELLVEYDIEYFDALQAAVALGRNAIIVANDEVFKAIGVEAVTFDELIKRAKSVTEHSSGRVS
jgi:predicted nucleic acid-binding protein